MISPKEKAELLFNKMDMIVYTDQDNWKSQCIRCALVVVKEILEVYESLDEDADIMFKTEIDYWQEVKSELKKL